MKKDRFHIIQFLLIALMYFVNPGLKAQQSNTFYLMHDVPQSNLLNPAVQIECKWYIGIPVIASTHINYSNTAFTYNDLAGSQEWGFEKVYDQMHRVDLIALETEANLISLGYRHRKDYFTLNISERAASYNTIPKTLARLALQGNSPFVGETASISSLRPSAIYYREYAIGYSRVVDMFTTLGVRAKLLFGKADLNPGRTRVGLTTDQNTFDLHLAGDYTLNSSFPMTIYQNAGGDIDSVIIDDLDYRRLLLNRQNKGVAIDLGVIYHYNEKITLSASILDLGFIRWNSDLNNVQIKGTFDYTGAPSGTDFTTPEYINNLRDSLLDAFDQNVTQRSYTSWLPTQFFLGGTYQVRENIFLGLTNRNVFFRKKIHSSFTVSGNADISDRLLATVSWSYLNNSLKNLGAGLAVHGRGMQFHIVTDNLIGFLQPFDTRSVNLRAGFNLMLGCPRDKREVDENSSYTRGLSGGNCGWAKTPDFRKQYRKEAAKRIKSRK